MKRVRVAVFGSTGSIGRSALDVISRLPDRFELAAIAASTSTDIICRQARAFRPRRVILTDERSAAAAARSLGRTPVVSGGTSALVELAGSDQIDLLVMAMSGTDGLRPVMAALRRGRRVALATKEILVGFGKQVMGAARRFNGMVVPVDSELAALHQCLDGREPSQIRRLILTASGGPFWRTGPPPLASVRQALRHPTWQMGRKITVDSATLMNKGLEVIEAVRLFDVTPERVETIIHPQSIVHSMVEFTDGSVLAQLSEPDMRLPIQYALTWPNRLPSPVRPLTFAEVGRLEFRPTRPWLFPCLRLAYASLRAGPAGPCVLNAANEVAVSAFLAGRIAFGAIPAIIRTTLTRLGRKPFRGRDSIEWLLRLEAEAARLARSLISGSSSRKGH